MTIQARIFVGTVGEGVFRSDDDGASFVRRSTGMFVECDVRALVADPRDPRVIYAGTSEGLYRSADAGDHWNRIESPMNRLVIWSLLLDPGQPDTIYAGTRPPHIFRSCDSGQSWTQVAATLNQECNNLVYNRVTTLVSDPQDRGTIWAGVETDGILCGSERGECWQRLNSGLSSLDIHALAIVTGPAAARMLAATNNDLNVSVNRGVSWRPLGLGKQADWPYFRGVASLIANPEVVLLGNGDGPPGRIGALWRSEDGGEHWRPVDLPCIPNSTVWGFATHPSDSGRVYMFTVSGELYGSSDAGVGWWKLPREFGEIRSLLWVPA